jgi:hypothetical protein
MIPCRAFAFRLRRLMGPIFLCMSPAVIVGSPIHPRHLSSIPPSRLPASRLCHTYLRYPVSLCMIAEGKVSATDAVLGGALRPLWASPPPPFYSHDPRQRRDNFSSLLHPPDRVPSGLILYSRHLIPPNSRAKSGVKPTSAQAAFLLQSQEKKTLISRPKETAVWCFLVRDAALPPRHSGRPPIGESTEPRDFRWLRASILQQPATVIALLAFLIGLLAAAICLGWISPSCSLSFTQTAMPWVLSRVALSS